MDSLVSRILKDTNEPVDSNKQIKSFVDELGLSHLRNEDEPPKESDPFKEFSVENYKYPLPPDFTSSQYDPGFPIQALDLPPVRKTVLDSLPPVNNTKLKLEDKLPKKRKAPSQKVKSKKKG